MPKRDRTAIYETLFNDGVLTAMKDFNAPRHPDVEGVKNLYVIKACQSLVSKGYATEQFSWRHYYWYLNNDGVNYLRSVCLSNFCVLVNIYK
jgi:small subunit ribosomal protein S10e